MKTLDMREGFAEWSWWVLASAFLVGAVARVATIDRGTPGIGMLVYVVMMTAVLLLIAAPTGIAAGIVAALTSSRVARIGWWRNAATACAAVIAALMVWALLHLGRSSPPWHVVWPTMLWAALWAVKTMPMGAHLVDALRGGGKP